MSAVMWACKGQHVEVVEVLMKKFAETNHEEVEKVRRNGRAHCLGPNALTYGYVLQLCGAWQDRYTALMWAAECEDPRAARALLQSQTTDVDLISLTVRTPRNVVACLGPYLRGTCATPQTKRSALMIASSRLGGGCAVVGERRRWVG